MRYTFATAAALLSLGQVVMARNTTDVRDFFFYPQQSCTFQGINVCDPNALKDELKNLPSDYQKLADAVKDVISPCGGGNMCVSGICGHFGGKDKMCCGGKGSDLDLSTISSLNDIGPTFKEIRDACIPYQDVLGVFDFSKASKPMTTGCSLTNRTENYPVGLSKGNAEDLLRGTASKVEQCCSIQNDSINVYSDLLTTIDKAYCIPPVGKGNPKLTYDPKAAADKKSGAGALAPVSFVVFVAAGLTVAGLL